MIIISICDYSYIVKDDHSSISGTEKSVCVDLEVLNKSGCRGVDSPSGRMLLEVRGTDAAMLTEGINVRHGVQHSTLAFFI